MGGWPTLPLLAAFAHIVEEDVVLERVGDEPLGTAVFATVLHPVLLLGKLEELLRGVGFSGGDHQQACDTRMSRKQLPATSHRISERSKIPRPEALRD